MNQKSFRLNYCVDEDTHDGALAKYLEQHRLSKKQVMLEAIRMYWMPLALKEAGVTRSPPQIPDKSRKYFEFLEVV